VCASPKGAGETCSIGACDFYAGLYCANSVCRSTQRVAPGQACDVANGIGCAARGFCRVAGSTSQGTCVAPARDGEACDTQNGPFCERGAYCSGGFCKVVDPTVCN
jgi:hypothetical protein